MTKAVRATVSKKLRFEVFKRDAFTCQYCGAHPPNVLLHVDHINPVANGGKNDIDNLVTSCEPCNLGKGARLLTVVPETLAAKAAAVAEREAQLLGYQEILEAKRARIEDELWRVAEVVDPGSSKLGMSRDWTASIRRFNERLGVHAVLDAAEIARGRYPWGGKRTFLYFCGICWNLVRQADAGRGGEL
ncbi:HNH endonuclease [Variovorax atrisoli]|uniref:HNH endonuclease n=1 Tax=Variovorax atrisoli TaxID=3394203 RepID=UPI000364EB18|nr:HNH endonuclease [Variovorax paradoxus]